MQRVLFSRGSVGDWLNERSRNATEAVEALPDGQLLAAAEEDLVTEIVMRFSLTEPKLLGDRYLPHGVQETRIDVRGDPMRAVFDRSRPALVPAHKIEVREHFEGDPAILDYRPSSFDLSPPTGDVQSREVVVTVERPVDAADQEQINSAITGVFAKIGRYLESAAVDVRSFNSSLPGMVRTAVENRRRRLEAGRGLEAALGLPVRRRDNADPALAIHVAPRQPVPVVRTGSLSTAQTREPFVSDADYHGVVVFLASIRRLIERLPHTFSSLPEEGLRDILLLILNNHFGPSTGETFSRSGKTDIFVTTPDGPVFIAECKFWSGQKAFGEAIDQLLGYLVWRDTKAALVVFVRERNVSAIAERALKAVRAHSQYVRDGAGIGGDPTAVLHHAGDTKRLVRVAVIVVPVPRDGEPPPPTPG